MDVGHSKDTQLVETNAALFESGRRLGKMKDSIQKVKLSIGQAT